MSIPPVNFTQYLYDEEQGYPLNAVPPLNIDLSTNYLSISDATATSDGTVSTSSQTFGGAKTFASAYTQHPLTSSSTELTSKSYVDNLIAGNQRWLDPVLAFADVRYVVGPTIKNRYIQTVTAGGFIQNDIEEYLGSSMWQATTAVSGDSLLVYTDPQGRAETYIFTTTGNWVPLGTSMDHYDLFHIGVNTHAQIDTALNTLGGSTPTGVQAINSTANPTFTSVNATLSDTASGTTLPSVFKSGDIHTSSGSLVLAKVSSSSSSTNPNYELTLYGDGTDTNYYGRMVANSRIASFQFNTPIDICSSNFGNIIELTNSSGTLTTTSAVSLLTLASTATTGQAVSIASSQASTDSTTGALVVTGGSGIGGALNVAGKITCNVLSNTNTTDSSSIGTGSIITLGGIGVAKKAYFGDAIHGPSVVTGTTTLSQGTIACTTTPALNFTYGGVTKINIDYADDFAEFLFTGGVIIDNELDVDSLAISQHSLSFASYLDFTDANDIFLILLHVSSTNVNINATDASTSSSTGALTIGTSVSSPNAGLGVLGNIWSGGTINTSLTTGTALTVASTASSTSLTTGCATFCGGIGVNGAVFSKQYNSVGTGNPAIQSNIAYQAWDTKNAYIQNNIQNLSNGHAASCDYVATPDSGTDGTGYIDMGINGSGYSDVTWTINGANDGYLYTQGGASVGPTGGNLAIGTASANTKLVLFSGGTLAANTAMTFDSSVPSVSTHWPLSLTQSTGTALAVSSTTASTSTTTGSVTFAGGLGVNGTIHASEVDIVTTATAPTVTTSDNSTNIATTAFCHALFTGGFTETTYSPTFSGGYNTTAVYTLTVSKTNGHYVTLTLPQSTTMYTANGGGSPQVMTASIAMPSDYRPTGNSYQYPIYVSSVSGLSSEWGYIIIPSSGIISFAVFPGYVNGDKISWGETTFTYRV
jgi:hypothetical protein